MFSSFESRENLFYILAWVLLIALTVLCYTPSLCGPFVYDDTSLIRDNSQIKSFSNTKEWFLAPLYPDESTRYYRPLLLAAFAIDYSVWKLDVFGFHSVNLLWHIANTLLMAMLARRIGWNRWMAFLSASLFALLPLNTQAVCYMSGRGDVQFLGLSLLTCHAILNAWKKNNFSAGWNLLAAFLFIAALFTKEMAAITLMWVMLLAWLQKPSLEKFLTSMIFLIIGLFFVLSFRWDAEGAMSSLPCRVPFPPLLIPKLFFRAIGFYTVQFLAPTVLALDRSLIASTSLHHFFFGLGVVIFFATLYAAFKLHQKNAQRSLFCLTWVVVGFLPISNLIRLSATAADHWFSPAALGLCWGAALALSHLFLRLEYRKKLLLLFLIVSLLSCWSLRLYARSMDWSSGISLYRANIEEGILSTRIFNNYGLELAGYRKYPEALKAFDEALKINPANLSARANHGFILFVSGQKEAGRAELQKLVRENPHYEQGWVAWMLTFRNEPEKLKKIGNEALKTEKNFSRVKVLQEQNSKTIK